MYGTCESAPIQAKLNTCSNKDFNVDIDEGILRRGVVQMYESRFIKDIEDDWKTHTFKRVDNYGKKFECELYKNAYLHLLLSYFSLNVFIPKKNEEMFKDIAEEYDDFSNIFNELFIHTKNEEIIGRLSNESAINTLGTHFDLKNSFASHFECAWDKLTNISMKLQSIKFNQQNAIKHCNYFIAPKPAFGCTVVDFDREEMIKTKKHMEINERYT